MFRIVDPEGKEVMQILPSTVLDSIEQQVSICIDVLKRYAAGIMLSTNQCDALDDAIEQANAKIQAKYIADEAWIDAEALEANYTDHDWHDNPLDH